MSPFLRLFSLASPHCGSAFGLQCIAAAGESDGTCIFFDNMKCSDHLKSHQNQLGCDCFRPLRLTSGRHLLQGLSSPPDAALIITLRSFAIQVTGFNEYLLIWIKITKKD